MKEGRSKLPRKAEIVLNAGIVFLLALIAVSEWFFFRWFQSEIKAVPDGAVIANALWVAVLIVLCVGAVSRRFSPVDDDDDGV